MGTIFYQNIFPTLCHVLPEFPLSRTWVFTSRQTCQSPFIHKTPGRNFWVFSSSPSLPSLRSWSDRSPKRETSSLRPPFSLRGCLLCHLLAGSKRYGYVKDFDLFSER